MSTNDLNEKERIARELGWSSYDAAPPVVRNNIDAKLSDELTTDICMRAEQ